MLLAGVVAALALAAPASAGHQFLWWNDGGSSFAQFEPNATLRIHTGAIDFVNSCPVPGIPDSIWPWTDVYIVPAGSVSDGSQLTDVGGGPANAVMGSSMGGVFIEEVIGFTAPSVSIGAGEYAVVYDECQDGKFQAGVGALFDPPSASSSRTPTSRRFPASRRSRRTRTSRRRAGRRRTPSWRCSSRPAGSRPAATRRS